jgi:hypothetical protein
MRIGKVLSSMCVGASERNGRRSIATSFDVGEGDRSTLRMRSNTLALCLMGATRSTVCAYARRQVS